MAKLETYKILSVPYYIRPQNTHSSFSGYSDGELKLGLRLFDGIRYWACKVEGGVIVFNHNKCVFFSDGVPVNKMFNIIGIAGDWKDTVTKFNKNSDGVAKIIY